MRELVAQVSGDVVHPIPPQVQGVDCNGGFGLASRPTVGDARHTRSPQRAFLVARLRGGVSRSAMVAIAEGTSR